MQANRVHFGAALPHHSDDRGSGRQQTADSLTFHYRYLPEARPGQRIECLDDVFVGHQKAVVKGLDLLPHLAIALPQDSRLRFRVGGGLDT